MMFCFKSILQIWIILIGFRDTNDFVNLGICKHEFKFTCRGYCRFTLIDVGTNPKADISMKLISNLVQLIFRCFLRSRYRFPLYSLAFSKFSYGTQAVTMHAAGGEFSNKDDVDSKPIRSAYSLFPFFIRDDSC